MRQSSPNFKVKEFKFSSLWKHSKPQYLDLAVNLKKKANGIHFWVVDKRFAVFVEMIYSVIEPAVTGPRYNLFAKGFGRKLCNQIYNTLKSDGTPGVLNSSIKNEITYALQ